MVLPFIQLVDVFESCAVSLILGEVVSLDLLELLLGDYALFVRVKVQVAQ